jgi:hypothetical protein
METTFMAHSSPIPHEQNKPWSPERSPDWLHDDPRWCLAERIVAGPHFSRSALLSKFLLFVVAETIEGRENEISEHQIGVHVFDRRSGYSTVEDNIVRNYARQLRKRLAEHFANQGNAERLRIVIPHGGYVPMFVRASESEGLPIARKPPLSVGIHAESAARSTIVAVPGLPRSQANWKIRLLASTAAIVYSAALVCLTWFIASRTLAAHPIQGPAHPLWAALFGGPANTYIVPADAGFNLLEDLSRQPVALADYIDGKYLGIPLTGVDSHSADDLRSQQFTSFVDFQIGAALARLPEYNAQRTFLRFPRDLRLDDLKNSNAILIGSVGSNPWASLADSSTNFRIVYSKGMQGAAIINSKPQPGEAQSYESHWNEPAHETFALVAYIPNLSRTGHLLLLQGLDVAGTQAAAEALLHQDVIAPVLRRATRPDGSLRNFEILLRATSIESNSTGTAVVASRVD